MRIRRILCPIDLNSKSDEALRYAVTLAGTYEAKLFVFHCLRSTGFEPVDDADTEAIQARERMRQQFSDSVGNHRTSSVVDSQWEAVVSRCENAGDAIVNEAANRNVDLIVMRSRRRPHRAALLGSTAEQICRTASCPVLVTHSEERDWVDSRSKIQLKRVLVAYDFSDFSEFALNYALTFAQEYEAELHLLHVLPPSSINEPEISWQPFGQEGAYHIAARRLQKSVPSEAHLWCKIRHIVSEGQPYREILNYAETNQIDLICIGAHGAGFGMKTLFGSNVDRVLRQAPCPVLVARPLKPVVSRENVPLPGARATRSNFVSDAA